MPAKTPRQQRAAGADVARCAQGDEPRTFPTCKLAREFARKPPGGYQRRRDAEDAVRQGYTRPR